MLKSGLGRITENTPQYQGVIVYSMNDLPLVSGVPVVQYQIILSHMPSRLKFIQKWLTYY